MKNENLIKTNDEIGLDIVKKSDKVAIYKTNKQLSPYFDDIKIYNRASVYVAQNVDKFAIYNLGTNEKLSHNFFMPIKVHSDLGLYSVQSFVFDFNSNSVYDISMENIKNIKIKNNNIYMIHNGNENSVKNDLACINKLENDLYNIILTSKDLYLDLKNARIISASVNFCYIARSINKYIKIMNEIKKALSIKSSFAKVSLEKVY